MKKYLLLLFVATIGLSSCKKEVINSGQRNRTILVDIPGSNWRPENGGRTYSTIIDVPENNAQFNQSGHIVVAMAFENPDVYEGLPQVYLGISYTFTSQPGSVKISQNAPLDNHILTQPTGVSTAKITLVDSDIIN